MVFQKLNKGISSLKTSVNNSGQVAIVLIIVIAIALIFYAITLNLGDVSQVKTTTQVAAAQGASLLASQMASYGQSKFKQELGGRREYCKSTSLLAALLTIVAIVVLMYVCGSCGTAVMTSLKIGLAFAVGGALVNALIIQPAITDLWNKMQALMGPADRFLESAIRQGLQTAVGDTVEVGDFFDHDGDGKFRFTTDAMGRVVPEDTISRFSIYYSDRMGQIKVLDTEFVSDFKDALEEFVYVNENDTFIPASDPWGLFDNEQATTAECIFPAECEPCCVPLSYTDPDDPTIIIDVRAEESYDLGFDCSEREAAMGVSWDNWCEANSPYPAPYHWVYDASRQSFANNTSADGLSFSEMLGRDDEHKGFYNFGPGDPADITVQHFGETVSQFRRRDAWNVVTPPAFTSPPHPALDPKEGIVDFFYKIKEWGVDLTDQHPITDNINCYWHDHTLEAINGATNCAALDYPLELKQRTLVLPEDPMTLNYTQTWWVDGMDDNVATWPARAPDKFVLPGNIVASDDECAEEARLGNDIGFWRPGGDRFCSPGYPYYDQCPKHQSGTCTYDDGEGGLIDPGCICSDTRNALPATEFPEDELDAIIYGIPDVVYWAMMELIAAPSADIASLSSWYDQMAEWLEPNSIEDENGVLHDGMLIQMRDTISMIKNRLLNWREQSFTGTGCDEVWCTPDAACNAPAAEQATFGDGSLEDIITCLNYNADNNEQGFQDCYDPCSACADININATVLNNCANAGTTCCASGNTNCSAEVLPRSLVPFDPTAYVPPDTPLLNELFDCQASCQGDITACNNAFDACMDPGCANPHQQCVNDCVNDASAWNADCTMRCEALDCTCTDIPQCASYSTACTAAAGDPAACASACLTASNDWTFDTCMPVCDGDLVTCQNQCSADLLTCSSAPDCVTGAGTFSCLNEVLPQVGTYMDAIFDAKHDCQLPDNAFMTNIDDSIREARNQAAKFYFRADFLQDRLDEMDEIITILERAETEFTRFLDGPAADLKDKIDELTTDSEQPSGLPYQAIYAWQDEPTGNRPAPYEGVGYFNAVKVEARLPGRCDNACGVGGGGDPAWPWVRTWTKRWGTKRCYALESTDGIVKFRVTRFDESRDANVLTFPNGIKIWDFRYFNPDATEPFPGAFDAGNLIGMPPDPTNPALPPPDPGTCTDIVLDNPPGVPPSQRVYAGAVMMGKRLGNSTPPRGNPDWVGDRNEKCWDRINDGILKGGVVTELCARYYFHGGTETSGMSHMFIRCPGPW